MVQDMVKTENNAGARSEDLAIADNPGCIRFRDKTSRLIQTKLSCQFE